MNRIVAAAVSACVCTLAIAAEGPRTFDSPKLAADALIAAAASFDERVLRDIFGPDADDILLSHEPPQARQRAADFTREAKQKTSIAADPRDPARAFVVVGKESWPFPVPIVNRDGRWSFDVQAGRQELLYRRIGANELDAIGICLGYVEAQHEYALQMHEGQRTNQYAQRILSTPGKRDGLAWQRADGSWGGPVGEKIARAIEQGYTNRAQPYHGYYFRILRGQGPAATLGELDFVVKGVMIGGFALVAAPAEYGVTGVKTFIVSHEGVVYEKDSGPTSLDAFAKMERFDPDSSWTPVADE